MYGLVVQFLKQCYCTLYCTLYCSLCNSIILITVSFTVCSLPLKESQDEINKKGLDKCHLPVVASVQALLFL